MPWTFGWLVHPSWLSAGDLPSFPKVDIYIDYPNVGQNHVASIIIMCSLVNIAYLSLRCIAGAPSCYGHT